MRDRVEAGGCAGVPALGSHTWVAEQQPDYGAEDLAEIVGAEHDPFESPQPALIWLDKTEHYGIRISGRMTAHVGIVTVPVVVGSHEFAVVGYGGVIVTREYRGRGLGRIAMEAATARARELGPSLGLLFCWPSRVGFYRSLGWHEVAPEVPVVVEQPDGLKDMPMRTMWFPLRLGMSWPPGPVRLHSLPM